MFEYRIHKFIEWMAWVQCVHVRQRQEHRTMNRNKKVGNTVFSDEKSLHFITSYKALRGNAEILRLMRIYLLTYNIKKNYNTKKIKLSLTILW